MKLIKTIIRPNKVDEVKEALGKLNVSGLTVTEVRGHGKQKGHTAVYRGKEYNVSLLPKMQIEAVVPDLHPGARCTQRGEIFDCKADGFRSRSKATIAQPLTRTALALSHKEFGRSRVVKWLHVAFPAWNAHGMSSVKQRD